MVSASKIRKAQDLMRGSRPYARAMRQVIGHMAKANTEFKHPFLSERENVKRVGYIIVSTDRGLCGGLNSNLFRKLLAEIREWNEKNVEVDIVAIGSKANVFFRRLKVNLVGSAAHLGEKPKIEQLIGVIKIMLDNYSAGKIDRLILAYNDFVNTMTQKPVARSAAAAAAVGIRSPPQHDWDYLYEPDAGIRARARDEAATSSRWCTRRRWKISPANTPRAWSR